MSRSYRHSPFRGITTARSEKYDKREANQALRAASRSTLRRCSNYDDLLMPVMREVSNVWTFAKDGKMRMTKANYGQYFAKLMRK